MSKPPLNETFRELVNPEYNEEPVHYCKRCLSLNIKVDENDDEFCEDCTSTNIGKMDIFTWEKLYKDMYGINFLKQTKIGDF